MSGKELAALGVAQLQHVLRAGEASALDVADAYLEAGARSTLNAFLDVQPELTREQARLADRKLASARGGSPSASSTAAVLLGLPVAHKDIFVTRGWRSTAGSRMLADYGRRYRPAAEPAQGE